MPVSGGANGLIEYCQRQTRDGTPKERRLASASVCILKLAPKYTTFPNSENVEKIIESLFPGYTSGSNAIATSRSFLTSTTIAKCDLAELRRRQERLRDLCVKMALCFLYQFQNSAALIAAQQNLVIAADLHEVNNLELVSAYLLLAEVCIGLNKLREAEQHLSKANWVVMKNIDNKNIAQVQQRLYRGLGLHQAACGNNEEAIRMFAEQVYHASLMSGTDCHGAASGYYNLANVWFRHPDTLQTALSLYGRVIEAWTVIVEDQKFIKSMDRVLIGETTTMLTTTAEVLERSMKESSSIPVQARGLLALYLHRIGKKTESSCEKEKVTEMIKSRNINDESIQQLISFTV